MSRIIRETHLKQQKVPSFKRVAAYARVSIEKSSMLHSLSAQVSYYSELIKTQPNWRYAGVYADKALTGTKAERPEFQRLLADCRAGLIDMVIVKSISRFARNTVTLLETVRELKEQNIDVFFERENIHSTCGDGELMLSILASYAQAESFSVSENCKWRLRNNFKLGKPCITPIYGYKMHRNHMTVIPSEASVVQMIFQDCLDGMGKNAIMKKLNSLGILSRGNKQWQESTVESILHNEKYAGDLLLQKTFVPDHMKKVWKRNTGELPRYYVSDHHEPIIGRDTFDKVQELIRERASKFNASPKAARIYPFSKMITCGQCGAHYKRKTSRGKVFWNCSTFLTQGKQVCHAKQIPEDALYRLAAEVLGTHTFDDKLFQKKIKKLIIPTPNHVIFVFQGGHEIECSWEDKSRIDSWNDDAKQRAREYAYRRWGK